MASENCPETISGTSEAEPAATHAPTPARPAALLSGPSRGIHILPAPDADLPYTLDGDVWSMALIKELDSLWFGASGAIKVGDVLPTIKWEIDNNPGMYSLLRQSMETYGQRVPVYVARPENMVAMLNNAPTLSDGIHRVAIAEQLGWETMLVSDTPVTWHEWNESETGLKYRYLWETRLGMHR